MSTIPEPILDPLRAVNLMRKFGLEPDPWQADVLTGGHRRLILNCCRQAGKSTAVAFLALSETLFTADTFVVLVSRSLRQSAELFHILADYYTRLQKPICQNFRAHELRLANRSRVICLPCKADTVRGLSAVKLLIIDEAARVPDDLYRTVRPMLAVSKGRLILLSTPCGRRGFFYDVWANGGLDWHRIEVPATAVPRIGADHLAWERRELGESWFRQEYCCSFEALEGLVYPDFARCVVYGTPAPEGKKVGGVDFGLRNPFAAVWGVLDRDDVLWLTGEHYVREQSLAYHAEHLPRGVTWYADPEGAREILELKAAGLTITRGDNAQDSGIAAVRARVETGTLKILDGACPNLLAEARLYRYDPRGGPNCQKPLKESDHALDALRYLVSRIDYLRMARRKGPRAQDPKAAPTAVPPEAAAPAPRKWLSLYNESLWTGPNDVQTWIVPRW